MLFARKKLFQGVKSGGYHLRAPKENKFSREEKKFLREEKYFLREEKIFSREENARKQKVNKVNNAILYFSRGRTQREGTLGEVRV